jgi:hypothetical protein
VAYYGVFPVGELAFWDSPLCGGNNAELTSSSVTSSAHDVGPISTIFYQLLTLVFRRTSLARQTKFHTPVSIPPAAGSDGRFSPFLSIFALGSWRYLSHCAWIGYSIEICLL